jgi:hypothetical protein
LDGKGTGLFPAKVVHFSTVMWCSFQSLYTLVGERDADSACLFMNDVASRLINKVQLTTDGLHAYLEAVTDAFGRQIDFTQLQMIYGKEGSSSNTEKKYSPAECIGCKKQTISGNPDEPQ